MSLLLSIIALVAGPLIYRAVRSKRALFSALDGFLFVAIGGLVVLDVLPECLKTAGWWTLLFALLGFLGPSLIEHTFRSAAKSAHRVALFLGLISICAHALADGAALATSPGALSHAVILHRLPVGLTIWWLLKPTFGTRWASGALTLVAIATIAGFQFGELMVASLSSQVLALFLALVAGSLLHVVVHRTQFKDKKPPDRATLRKSRLLSGLGALAAVALLVSETHLAGIESASQSSIGFYATFRTLFLESAPALLLAYLLAGLVSAFLPEASIRWMRRGTPLTQSLRGMIVGLPLPVCSCGVVPLFRSLTQRGAPTAAALAFLIATPELSLDALLLSVPLLGVEMTLVRLIAAALVALAVGWFVGTLHRNSSNKIGDVNHNEHAAVNDLGLKAKLRKALHSGLEVLDHTAPWILLGLGIAALIEPSLTGEWLSRIPKGLEVPLFGLLGMPMYVCASGATPLVAVLLFKGVSPGAALAFLLTGPATNVTTFGVISSVLGRKLAVLFGAATAVLAIGLGFLVNQLLPKVNSIALADVAGEPVSQLGLICVVALSTLFLLSLLRQGARGFMSQILFR